jgi:16S rRNA (adenine1518-N6/adenine1519-N6)-dimethyltransferase
MQSSFTEQAGGKRMSDQLQRTLYILKKYEFSTKKKFGQNFLIDEGVLSGIVDIAGVSQEDHVLEIGPGIGSMTHYLCEQAGHVTAVEIDDKLIPILTDMMQGYDNFTLIHDDILKVDLEALAKEEGGRPFKVVANLPYYITTPIVMELLEKKLPIESITIMVQKEVAERMQAGPGTKAYGALSLAVQYYADAEIEMEVSPSGFLPPPQVSSTVIKLTRYEKPPVEVEDEKLMFRLIRDSFNQRRKTLVNALSNGGGAGISKDLIRESILEIGEKETVRGEALSLEKFAELSNVISAKKK